jgi:PAS domain S-box-containing protein
MASSGSSSTTPPWIRALQGAVVVLIAAYLVWTLPGVRPGPQFQVVLDGLLQGTAYVAVALLCAVGVLRRSSGAAWRWVTAAVALRAIGFVLTLAFLAAGAPLPYPSVADAAWVLSSLALIGAVALRLHELVPRLPRLVVLDALAVSLLLVGLVVDVLAEPLVTLTSPGVERSAVVVNIVYPLLDTALLVAAAALITAARQHLRPADLLLVSGIVAFVVVDVAYLVLLAEGLWRPGTLLSSLSLTATATIALAVWWAPGPPDLVRRPGELPALAPAPSITPPAIVACGSFVALTISGVGGAPVLALLLYSAAGLVAISRGVLTLQHVRHEAGLVLGEASEDLHRFHALVEASSDFIGMADHRGNVLYLNPGARRLLHLPPDFDVTTLTVADIVPSQGPASFEERWPVLLEHGVWEGESQVVPMDGSEPVPVATSTFVMRRPDTGEAVAMATIQRDIRELKRHEAALGDIADQRARLLTRLVQAQEDERAQVAADVHDDSVQSLAVVDLRLSTLRRRVATDDPALLEALDAVQESVSAATDRLRHLLFDLESPARTTTLGDALAHGAEVIFADTDIEWEITGLRDLDLPEAERVTAYRVAREAMVNARKHAGADHVVIDLCRALDAVVVSVRDDGRGIGEGEDRERPGHKGLASMRDRAQVAGGRLEVRRREQGGTEVRLTMPTAPDRPLAGPDT